MPGAYGRRAVLLFRAGGRARDHARRRGAAARARQHAVLALPRRARFIALRAVDDAGNLGAARVVRLTAR